MHKENSPVWKRPLLVAHRCVPDQEPLTSSEARKVRAKDLG